MEKIKVLMIGNDLSVKGGITSVISQILEYNWSSENIEIQFIPTYIESNKIKKIFYFIRAYYKIRKKIKEYNPDLVHIHMSYKGSFYRKYIIHKLCRKYGVSDIIHMHGSEFKVWFDNSNNYIKQKIRLLLREANAVIVLGEKWNKDINKVETDTNRVVLSNTVSIPKEVIRWNNPFQVIFLGVLIKRKGVEDLLNAIAILKKTNSIGCARFVIAGSGAEEEKLKEQCKKMEIDDRVEFIGWVDGQKKIKLLKESQLLVLPSYNEGLPIAIIEAISYGMPVVSTDVGDVFAAVKDNINGYLIEPGDIEELAKALKKIILDRNLYEKMSKMSRIIAEELFSDKKFFLKLSSCYQEIVRTKK